MRRGGTRAGFKVWLEGVSCVCGRTSSFPAGERNQRLPGAGEDSMRRAGPRTPLMQAACVGGASRGRAGAGFTLRLNEGFCMGFMKECG